MLKKAAEHLQELIKLKNSSQTFVGNHKKRKGNLRENVALLVYHRQVMWTMFFQGLC